MRYDSGSLVLWANIIEKPELSDTKRGALRD